MTGTVFIQLWKMGHFGNFWEKNFFLRGHSGQIFFGSKNSSVTLFVYEILRKMVGKKKILKEKMVFTKNH